MADQGRNQGADPNAQQADPNTQQADPNAPALNATGVETCLRPCSVSTMSYRRSGTRLTRTLPRPPCRIPKSPPSRNTSSSTGGVAPAAAAACIDLRSYLHDLRSFVHDLRSRRRTGPCSPITIGTAPGGVEPPHAASKAAALSAELRGLATGVADGIRTRDHRDHNPGLYQLSYRHRAPTSYRRAGMRPGGFEPPTIGLEGRCSSSELRARDNSVAADPAGLSARGLRLAGGAGERPAATRRAAAREGTGPRTRETDGVVGADQVGRVDGLP